jgi:protein phosphatase
MNVRCSADTHIGRKREVNQDSYGIGDLSLSKQRGYLLVVCDGMGGHTAGEVASRLGVETILAHYYTTEGGTPQASLEHAFYEANRRIYDQSQGQGQGNMGTTGVAVLLLRNTLYIANVGDSRAYLVRDDQIEQISRDHSLVAEQVAAGIITTEQARHSHYRNMITRALGYRSEVQVDVFAIPAQPGDMVVLSSDGLHSLVEDDEIEQIVKTMPPENAVQHLINTANDRGGTDNITVALALVDELDDLGETPPPDGNDDETTTVKRVLPESPDKPKETTPLDDIDDMPDSTTAASTPPGATNTTLKMPVQPEVEASPPLNRQLNHTISSPSPPPAAPSQQQAFASFPLNIGLLGGAVVVLILGVLGFVVLKDMEDTGDASLILATQTSSPPAAGGTAPFPLSTMVVSTTTTTTATTTASTPHTATATTVETVQVIPSESMPTTSPEP